MSRTHPPALPHGPILELGTGMHWVRGSIKMGPGIRVSRNMAIIEHDGDVTLVNPVRLNEDGEAQLAALGKVAHAVKLGFFHGRDDAYYRDHFGAKYWALPKGTRDVDPPADETLAPDQLPVPDSSLFVFEHAKKPEAALLVQRDGGLMITCDSVQHWPDTSGCSIPAKVVTRAMGFTKRPAQIGPPWRKFMTPSGGTLREDFVRLAACEFERLIGAHGAPLTSGASAALRATVAVTFPSS